MRLNLDWETLIKAQHLLSHLGKLRPGSTGDLPDLVHQAVGGPGLELGPLPGSFSPSLLLPPHSSLALSLLVTQGSESSSGTREETS